MSALKEMADPGRCSPQLNGSPLGLAHHKRSEIGKLDALIFIGKRINITPSKT